MIDTARGLGYEVYYGDGTRLDILYAAGAAEARVILVCVDRKEDATLITERAKAAFPDVPLLVRASDRRHAVELVHAGADLQVKETFESALVLGASALDRLGATQAEIADITARVRDNDAARMAVELERGLDAGMTMFSRRRADGDAH